MSATVLCVHEDAAMARIYAETLDAEGYEVLCASDGRQTFEILRDRHPDFAVIDAYLPRQDGFEILAEMRSLEDFRATPVLILTEGDITDELFARATELGAVGIEASPLTGRRLVECVAEFVKPPAAENVWNTGDAKMPSAGSLEEIPIPELIHGLRMDRHTGVLSVAHGKRKKAIEFREGWPVSVKSNLISECLGNYLVREERVSQTTLDESVTRMRAGEGLQGQIIVAMDVLSEDAMVEALRDHALEKFYEIFGWRRGEFLLRSEAHVQRGSTLGLEGHPAHLVVEGVRRNFPLKQIDRYMSSHREGYVVPRATAEEEVAELGLSAAEREWVAALDGSMKIEGLLVAEEWIRRLLFGLVTIEVLEVVETAVDARDGRALAPQLSSVHDSPRAEEDESMRAELVEVANRIRNRDHYGVLDVPSTASDEEIRIAFVCLSKRTHPDRFHGASHSVRQLAEQVFGRIAEAQAAIATAAARQSYASDLARGRRDEVVEEEGRRALAAETEFQKGEAKMAKRDYEGALLCFGRAMENFSAEGEYRSHYGWCLHLCHPDNDVMLGEALEHCREGLKLAKDREKPYLLLGRLYKAMGKMGAAKKMFSRAVEIKPQCVEAMRELRIMNMRRDKDQSLGKGVLKRIFRR